MNMTDTAIAASSSAFASTTSGSVTSGGKRGAHGMPETPLYIPMHAAVRMIHSWLASHPKYGPMIRSSTSPAAGHAIPGGPLSMLPLDILPHVVAEWLRGLTKSVSIDDDEGQYCYASLSVYVCAIQRVIRLTTQQPNYSLTSHPTVVAALRDKAADGARMVSRKRRSSEDDDNEADGMSRRSMAHHANGTGVIREKRKRQRSHLDTTIQKQQLLQQEQQFRRASMMSAPFDALSSQASFSPTLLTSTAQPPSQSFGLSIRPLQHPLNSTPEWRYYMDQSRTQSHDVNANLNSTSSMQAPLSHTLLPPERTVPAAPLPTLSHSASSSSTLPAGLSSSSPPSSVPHSSSATSRPSHGERRLLSARQDPATPEGLLRCLLWIFTLHLPTMRIHELYNMKCHHLKVKTMMVQDDDAEAEEKTTDGTRDKEQIDRQNGGNVSMKQEQRQNGVGIGIDGEEGRKRIASCPTLRYLEFTHFLPEPNHTPTVTIMYEQPTLLHCCPVTLFEAYMARRPPPSHDGESNSSSATTAAAAAAGSGVSNGGNSSTNEDAFWLSPKKHVDVFGCFPDAWYSYRRIGLTTLDKLVTVVRTSRNLTPLSDLPGPPLMERARRIEEEENSIDYADHGGEVTATDMRNPKRRSRTSTRVTHPIDLSSPSAIHPDAPLHSDDLHPNSTFEAKLADAVTQMTSIKAAMIKLDATLNQLVQALKHSRTFAPTSEPQPPSSTSLQHHLHPHPL